MYTMVSLQHPGHTRLEETIRATMTWSGMRDNKKTCKDMPNLPKE